MNIAAAASVSRNGTLMQQLQLAEMALWCSSYSQLEPSLDDAIFVC